MGGCHAPTAGRADAGLALASGYGSGRSGPAVGGSVDPLSPIVIRTFVIPGEAEGPLVARDPALRRKSGWVATSGQRRPPLRPIGGRGRETGGHRGPSLRPSEERMSSGFRYLSDRSDR